uniref:Uncharacterized protein n=1 Tax=Meloidogyne enterolobii TaxID=390850 RepID=A0A6V7YAE3_MELEN|nr:unnamed protein product [Meloidogyne enterolobii]
MFEKNTKIFFQNWPAKIEGKRGRKTHKNIHSFPLRLFFRFLFSSPLNTLIPSFLRHLWPIFVLFIWFWLGHCCAFWFVFSLFCDLSFF